MLYLQTRIASSRFPVAVKLFPHLRTSTLRSLSAAKLHRALHQTHISRVLEPGHGTDTRDDHSFTKVKIALIGDELTTAWFGVAMGGLTLGLMIGVFINAGNIKTLKGEVTALETYTGIKNQKEGAQKPTLTQLLKATPAQQEQWVREAKLRSQEKAFEQLITSRGFDSTQTHIALLSKEQFLDALDRSVEGSAKPIEQRNKEIQERRESELKQQLSQVKIIEEENTEIEGKLESDLKRVKTIVEKNKEIQGRLESDLGKPLNEGRPAIAVVAPKR